jgi:imidazolonepropionase-like amidohydrolase
VTDLSKLTCLPGLIDTHTHVLLQGDITADDYDAQLLKQSPEYRTILATVNARRALSWGFTTIRDIETEGAGYADVDVKHAIERGIIPGPRMQVAGRAMDVTGAYPLLGYAPAVVVPKGVQEVDGADGGRRAVREQLSHGVDWIKVYSDRSYFVREDGVLDDIPTFTLEELRAIVDETHRQRHKIASHATALNGVHNSVEAGVDTIEHGDYIADADLATMVRKGIYYVPTIYVGEYVAEGRAKAGAPVWLKMVSIHEDTFRRALKAGVKIAFGTDVGGFDWQINPAIEFSLMVKYGMTPEQALRAATVTAAELLGWQDKLGTVEAGKLADLVLWTPAFFGVKPDLIIKGGMIAAAPMGDPNASIPTPQPVHYRPMFGSYGAAISRTALTFVSQLALDKGIATNLRVSKQMVAVQDTRKQISKKSMIHNGATPKLRIDPETYAVTADGVLLTCEPASVLPMTQRYFMF